MPQFDFAHVVWPQLIWLAIFFAILYFAIVLPTLPKLGRVMTARENQMTDDIATAEQAKADAERLAAEYEAGVAAAQDSARAQLLAARAAAAKSIENQLATANLALDAKSAAAQASLDAARTSAMAEIEGVAADAAAAIVEKLTGTRPAASEAAQAARAALV